MEPNWGFWGNLGSMWSKNLTISLLCCGAINNPQTTAEWWLEGLPDTCIRTVEPHATRLPLSGVPLSEVPLPMCHTTTGNY